jgi:hypothetical protein
MPKKNKVLKQKSKHVALLLDIEGESKPLSLKYKGNKNSIGNISRDNSIE